MSTDGRSRSPLAAGLAALILASLAAACATNGGGSRDLGEEPEIARGGRLYDNWIKETQAAPQAVAHLAYPQDAGYAGQPDATWRCKECHGWDYRGRDGAYASGKHATGIAGIDAARGRDVAALERVLTDATHGYGDVLAPRDVRALALFVANGQVAMDAVIERATKRAHGDATRGMAYYQTLCAPCHGPDGRAQDMPVLGEVANDNPWETLHKILNGQPGTAMPALRALEPAVAADVLAYVQTLPQEEAQ